MFTNLIESDSHREEFKRRSSFFLVTVAAYSVVLFAAGVVSILAYDAKLESQTNSLEVLNWIPPATTPPYATPPRNVPPQRRIVASNAPVDPNINVPIRTNPQTTTDDLRLVPPTVSTSANNSQTVTGPVQVGDRNANPQGSEVCPTCNSTQSATIVQVERPQPTPEPTPVKPQTQRVSTQVLISKAVSLPQPPYPTIAKRNGIAGPVPVQVLIDESGKVISAHAVGGSPFLTGAAENAAKGARFTPTTLNGAPVKVQGVITYNFVLQ